MFQTNSDMQTKRIKLKNFYTTKIIHACRLISIMIVLSVSALLFVWEKHKDLNVRQGNPDLSNLF